MAKKTFTKKEMQIIQSNPNTLSVTEHRITLTLEAKEKILMLSKSGMPISRILNELGYDSLLRVTLPSRIIEIREGLFIGCHVLNDVFIPLGLQ